MDAATATSIAATPVRDWIVRHDDSRAFVLLYVVLALVLSIAIGLFWLLALVGVHLAFEYVCARHRGAGARRAAAEALWALKLDLALVLFALTLSLYLKYVFGLLGLQAAGRAASAAQAGVRGGVRFAAWERVVHGFLITVDDMARGVRAVAVLRGQGAGKGAAAPEPVPAAAARRLGRGDVLTLVFGGACLALILAAPWLGYAGWTEAFATLAAELRPFPTRGG
jgi:hypothetical protein